jgi:DNA mismatch repair protein MutL
LGLTYLVAESADSLVLIDQHAAHERVLYEALMGRRGAVATQGLLVPEVVELAPREMDAFEAYHEALKDLGFGVEAFGEAAVAVRSVPDVAATGDAGGLLRAVLDGLDGGADLVATAVHERIASIVCKRVSVKAGQALGPAEARALIEALEATASPRTCPHGRPTMVEFSRQRLEREFGRT